MATAKKTTETIEMKPIKIARLNVRIVGDKPLIVHAWDQKAKREMLDNQMNGKKKIKARPAKMPFDDFARSLYWMDDDMPTETITDPNTKEDREVVTENLFDEAIENGARFGFPVNSFKMAANSAAYRMGWVPNQMVLRGAYFLNAHDGGHLAEIKGNKPVMREDMVRIPGTSDIRYRAMFEHWYCDLVLEYNASGAMKLDDIMNCINAGGYSVGVGEWRPERDGDFGRFHIEIVK